jgi:hypothetical protein
MSVHACAHAHRCSIPITITSNLKKKTSIRCVVLLVPRMSFRTASSELIKVIQGGIGWKPSRKRLLGDLCVV